MLFNSLIFLVFFAAVLILHYLPIPWSIKKLNLLCASYLFYAAWNPPFILLLWISTIVAWLTALAMDRSRTPLGRRLLLCISLVVDLGLLSYFKYGKFALENFTHLMHQCGINFEPPAFDIVLPIGISFYTFHTLSYTIDVYRKHFPPCRSLLDFSLYVAFFPQLVAGPIVRARQFLPQCGTPKQATINEFAWGLNLMIIGLFCKIVLADRIFRPIADAVFQEGVHPDSLSAFAGMMAFGGQIYCDFGGYSTCAIGIALCLGFALPDNFRWPMGSVGFVDFWRRWHISLSTWMRDYVYVSLGGRPMGLRATFNIFVTMLLVGLWHGAAWTFVVFGSLHGVALAIETNLRAWRPVQRVKLSNPLIQGGLAVFTGIAVAWTGIFFRARSINQGMEIAMAALGWDSATSTFRLSDLQLMWVLIPCEALFIVHFFLRDTTLEESIPRWPVALWMGCVALMATAIVLSPGDQQAYLYFQF